VHLNKSMNFKARFKLNLKFEIGEIKRKETNLALGRNSSPPAHWCPFSFHFSSSQWRAGPTLQLALSPTHASDDRAWCAHKLTYGSHCRSDLFPRRANDLWGPLPRFFSHLPRCQALLNRNCDPRRIFAYRIVTVLPSSTYVRRRAPPWIIWHQASMHPTDIIARQEAWGLGCRRC
jgi:hypothetical protein